MSDTRGFYCNTKALNKTERERYNQLAGKLANARVETKELPDGYGFRLNSEMITLPEVGEWISWERKCCPFFGFEIALERYGLHSGWVSRRIALYAYNRKLDGSETFNSSSAFEAEKGHLIADQLTNAMAV